MHCCPGPEYTGLALGKAPLLGATKLFWVLMYSTRPAPFPLAQEMEAVVPVSEPAWRLKVWVEGAVQGGGLPPITLNCVLGKLMVELPVLRLATQPEAGGKFWSVPILHHVPLVLV